MTDEEIQLSADAKRILESSACKHVLELMVTRYRKEIEDSKPGDTESREHSYRMILASKEFLRQLTALAGKGTLQSVRQKHSRGGDRSAL